MNKIRRPAEIMLLAVAVFGLLCVGCNSSGGNNSTSQVRLCAFASDMFDREEPMTEFRLALVLGKPVLARDIKLITGNRTWEIAKVTSNEIASLTLLGHATGEVLMLELTNDSLKMLREPQYDDEEFQETGAYGIRSTNYEKYNSASKNYRDKKSSIRNSIIKSIMSDLEKKAAAKVEIKGKLGNVTLSIPKEDILNVVKLWKIYQKF